MKYRKKPVVIDAVRWDATNESWDEIVAMGDVPFRRIGNDAFSIDTLEGEFIVSKGDFIIKGVEGEFYSCKPGIFEKTYEAVIDSTGGGDAKS